MKTIRLSGLIEQSLTNGEGLRKVIFSQTCYHQCKGCFNPETHNPNGGTLFELQEIVDKIKKDVLIDGVTFSGGDPFEQAEAFSELGKAAHESHLNVWCYTGYTYEYILEHQSKRKGWSKLLQEIDVLIDGKFEEELYDPNLQFKGSSNQRIIDVKASLEENQVIYYQLKKPQ